MEILLSSHLLLMNALGRYCTNNLSECVVKQKFAPGLQILISTQMSI